MKWIGIRLGLTLVFSGLILALLIPLSFFLYRDQQAASLKQLQDSLFLEGALLRRVLDSEIVQNDLAEDFYDYLVGVASGEKTKAEELGAKDLTIFKNGVTL